MQFARIYVGGKWCPPTRRDSIPVIDAARDEVIGRIPERTDGERGLLVSHRATSRSGLACRSIHVEELDPPCVLGRWDWRWPGDAGNALFRRVNEGKPRQVQDKFLTRTQNDVPRRAVLGDPQLSRHAPDGAATSIPDREELSLGEMHHQAAERDRDRGDAMNTLGPGKGKEPRQQPAQTIPQAAALGSKSDVDRMRHGLDRVADRPIVGGLRSRMSEGFSAIDETDLPGAHALAWFADEKAKRARLVVPPVRSQPLGSRPRHLMPSPRDRGGIGAFGTGAVLPAPCCSRLFSS